MCEPHHVAHWIKFPCTFVLSQAGDRPACSLLLLCLRSIFKLPCDAVICRALVQVKISPGLPFWTPTWQHSEEKSANFARTEAIKKKKKKKSRKSFGLFLWRAHTHKWILYRPCRYCCTLFGRVFFVPITHGHGLPHASESWCRVWPLKMFWKREFFPEIRSCSRAEVCLWATAGAAWCELFHRNIFSSNLTAVWCDRGRFFVLVFFSARKVSISVCVLSFFRWRRRAPDTWGGGGWWVRPAMAPPHSHTLPGVSVWRRAPMDVSNGTTYCVISASRHRWPAGRTRGRSPGLSLPRLSRRQVSAVWCARDRSDRYMMSWLCCGVLPWLKTEFSEPRY